MQSQQRPNVLITGVSTGIGFDATRYLIARGFHVFGSVRKQADAERLEREFPAHFTPLLFDVTDTTAIAKAVEQVKHRIGDRGLAALINNAGISGAAPLMHVPLDEVRRMFEVNVFGLLQVTQAFLPLLGATKNCPHAPGRVINISSISGGLVFPFVGIYGATKHAVEALTDGLRRELAISGIQVIGIEPGTIRTGIWEKGDDVHTRFAHTAYGPMLAKLPGIVAKTARKGDPAETVSRAIHRSIAAPRPKTRYPLTFLWRVSRILGDRALDRLTRSAMSL